MNDFEDVLGDALRRLEAPAGFAGRVQQRIADREWKRRQASNAQRWRFALAATILICCWLVGYQIYQRRQAEGARQQFAVAMQVTSRSLYRVKSGLNRLDRTDEVTPGETP